jgi:hypothetical protein
MINLFGVYHYDAGGATAECADLFGSAIIAGPLGPRLFACSREIQW